MTYSLFDGAKDFLGALGPVLIAVPWFSEFGAKRRRARLKRIDAEGGLKQWQLEITDKISEQIHSPKYRDVVWTLAGLACICASSLIPLVTNIGERLSATQ